MEGIREVYLKLSKACVRRADSFICNHIQRSETMSVLLVNSIGRLCDGEY